MANGLVEKGEKTKMSVRGGGKREDRLSMDELDERNLLNAFAYGEFRAGFKVLDLDVL